ncbi:hypothetical protein RchiOBHm_Chr2g0161731 [Rosa chinensis]|uniref:Uncharacterized protein n=1 Tax=Rosa chinensis TaxID=74649 RepID=A0A2P6S2W7_ROSCH|nr:hypothetical protein RchiOBHm_Chr2g0161731 [Rosa chinensis]
MKTTTHYKKRLSPYCITNSLTLAAPHSHYQKGRAAALSHQSPSYHLFFIIFLVIFWEFRIGLLIQGFKGIIIKSTTPPFWVVW